MLNDYQKTTIRVAVEKAVDKDAEIKKLAKGFKALESEIRDYWLSLPNASDKNKPLEAAKSPELPHPPKKPRIFWTPEMIQQMEFLRKNGETFPHIAEIMRLDVKQVVNKAMRKPDKRLKKAPNSSKADLENKSEIIIPPATKENSTITQPNFIDMPEAMFRLVELVRDDFCGDIFDIRANNEGYAVCIFDQKGVSYSLKLEVNK